MSLETLLEAAEFLEWRNQPKTRDGSPRDPHGYSRMSANDSDTSPDSSNSGRYRDEDGREKRRAGGAGTREVHNKLEKNRRAQLKGCFEFLKKQIPALEDKRTSNLSILRGSLRYIQALRRKEKEYELEMQKLAREKISLQERIATLKSELTKMNIEVDINHWIKVPDEETDSNSTSTATEQGSPIVSDIEEDEDDDMDEENEEHPRNKKQMFSVKEVIKKTSANLAAARNVISSKGDMTVLKVAPPAHQQNMKTLPKQGIHSATTSVITMATSATTGSGHMTLQAQRPPVTQILAQTLNQKIVQKQRETVISGGELVEKSPVAQILAQQLNQKTIKTVDKPPLQQMMVENNPSPSHNLEVLAQALSQRQVIQKPKNIDGINTQHSGPSLLSSVSSAGPTDHSDRTPVTQILAQQLNQRQMLQRQKSLDSTVTTTQTSLAKSVPQIVKSLSVRPSLSFTPINTQLMANPIHQLAALNRLTNIGTVPNQAAALTAIPTSTPTKAPAQPILVSNFHLASQLNAPPLAATSTTKVVTTTATITNTSATTSQKTTASHNEVVTTVSQSLPATAVSAVPAIRPIIGAPGSHFMASQLTPLNALLAQTIPRTTIGAVLQTMPSSTVTYTTSGPSQTASLQQLMSLAQMAPGTQLFSPMTVVSPNGSLVTTGIPQAQLNNVLMTQPLLKQIPLLTPAGILQGGQLSQMIGQPVVKPFVVVTVPSIATTTAPPAASVAMTVAMTTTS